MSNGLTAAASLLGRELPGGWVVTERLDRSRLRSGGAFSECYIVQRSQGQKAFLKAIDYSAALRDQNTALALQGLTTAFLFEKAILERCSRRGFSNVVLAIDSGGVTVPGFAVPKVDYLILELGDEDFRSFREASAAFNLAWTFRALHNVANGLRQLHFDGICHQDVRPSNVVVFGGTVSKLADLGRASVAGTTGPNDDFAIAGHRTYAAPEMLYCAVNGSSMGSRRAAEMYSFGALMYYLLTGVGLNASLAGHLARRHLWRNWRGPYEEVVPYVRDALDRVTAELAEVLPPAYRDRLLTDFRYLTDPDPNLRGERRARAGAGNQYSFERFVSRFDLLAREAELRVSDDRR